MWEWNSGCLEAFWLCGFWWVLSEVHVCAWFLWDFSFCGLLEKKWNGRLFLFLLFFFVFSWKLVAFLSIFWFWDLLLDPSSPNYIWNAPLFSLEAKMSTVYLNNLNHQKIIVESVRGKRVFEKVLFAATVFMKNI